MKYYIVICDLDDKYESDIKNVGEIQRHFGTHMDVAFDIGKTRMITSRRDTFDIIIDDGKKLIRIPPCDYGNIYIY